MKNLLACYSNEFCNFDDEKWSCEYRNKSKTNTETVEEMGEMRVVSDMTARQRKNTY